MPTAESSRRPFSTLLVRDDEVNKIRDEETNMIIQKQAELIAKANRRCSVKVNQCQSDEAPISILKQDPHFTSRCKQGLGVSVPPNDATMKENSARISLNVSPRSQSVIRG